MKKNSFKKFIAVIMAAAMLASPAIQAFANDPYSGDQSAFNVETVNSNLVMKSNKANIDKHVITLITGDVVTVTYIADGKSIISVEPTNRVSSGTRIMTIGQDTFVVPNEAMSYIASNFLDKSLFNITALIADGYDDKNQSTLPVIVQYEQTNSQFDKKLPATLSGSSRTNVLESIGGIAVSADKGQARAFWNDITENSSTASSQEKGVQSSGSIKKVWLDGLVKANLQESVPQVGAPTAWASGYDGTGVTVAVLDTGIDTEHPDVAPQIDKAVSFIPGEDAIDHHGHGTHVASTVLGTGAASQGAYKGVAPGANLIVGKVLGSDGYGQDSWVIEGMEWAAQNADVVNMSLSDPTPSDGTDPMSQAVNELSRETGALFVIAAGNTGIEGIGSPGAADAALTVGSVTKSEELSWFSSKGPRFMSSGLKPDLVAPGSAITAARSRFALEGEGFYLSLDGTSMASPHVAGAAAIIAQRYPDWKGEQLKSALISTTKELDHLKPYEGGAGLLDVATAISSTVYASGSLDFGFYEWPHEEDVPVEKVITYTNESDESITLDLSATFTDDTGAPSPEGLLKLSTNQVTVPAKGTAKVVVTANPELAPLASLYQGQLSAIIAGQTVAHTAMVMGKEDERFPLTINAINRDGSAGEAVITLVGPDNYPEFLVVKGSKELRLPEGIYSVLTIMDVDVNTDQSGIAVLGNPEVNLDGPKTVNLDVRQAKEITANISEKNEASYRKLEFFRDFSEGKTVGASYQLPDTIDRIYAQPTENVQNGIFEINTRWRLIKPLLTVNFDEVELDIVVQAGSTVLDGKHQLEVVYVGKGATNDYNGLDVKDKAVLVDRSDSVSGSERAAAAYAAGAKLIITVNDGPTDLMEWVGKEDNETANPIAVAAVSAREGKGLIQAALSGTLTLNVEGTPNSPYVYDLFDEHTNAIPEDLAYSPVEGELVKINAKYNSNTSALGTEFRWDIPWYAPSGMGLPPRLSLPTERTEWVSAPERGKTRWYHQASESDSKWEIRQPSVTYQPGQRLDEEWFAPVVRPRFGEGFWVPSRTGDYLQFNVPAWADSGLGHTGAYLSDYGQQRVQLYQGTTLLGESEEQSLYIDNVPKENTQYRLVNDATRDAERWNTSVKTHTEWTFWSKEEVTESLWSDLPMISLDYDVDTDMKGNAAAGDKIKLGLSASQIASATGNGKIIGASLEVSFDEGKEWEEVELVREGKGWTANINNPANSGTFVSLRASAWDDLGNKINQEIIKAFGLTESLVTLSADKLDYSLAAGTTTQMKVTEATTPEEGGEPTVVDVTNKATYVVENDAVASVKNGLITAKEKGTTKVKISYGGKEVTVNVTVTEEAVVTLSVNPSTLALTTGKTGQLTVTETSTPKEGTPKVEDVTAKATYTVADEKIATVKEGLVTGVAKGTTTITVSKGENEVTVNVTVTDPVVIVPGVKLVAEPAQLYMKPLETSKVKIIEVTTKANGDQTRKDVTNSIIPLTTYKSSNKSVATVLGGLVTAWKEGITTITAKYNGNSVNIDVTVSKKPIPVPVVTLVANPTNLDLKTEEEAQVTITEVTTLGDKVTEKDVTNDASYTVSDTKVASVDKGLVKALEAGKATITAKYGKNEAAITVTVKDPDPIITLVANPTSLDLKTGEEGQLTITEVTTVGSKVTEKDVTNDAQYTVSDAKVASVNKGLVKATEVGTATITAKFGDNEVTVNVTVTKAPEPVVTLVADQTQLELNPLEIRKLTIKEVTTMPDGTVTEKDVSRSAEYSVDNSLVAFAYKGYIMGLLPGKTTLTVNYGGQEVKVKVTTKFKFNFNLFKESDIPTKIEEFKRTVE